MLINSKGFTPVAHHYELSYLENSIKWENYSKNPKFLFSFNRNSMLSFENTVLLSRLHHRYFEYVDLKQTIIYIKL